jgi:flagellar hook-associated protein 1 FlgK
MLGVDNFSSILNFAVTQPQDFAAARDADPVAGSTVFPKGDSANAQAIAALRTTTFTSSVGSYTASNLTLEDQYNDLVTYVGNVKSTANLNAKVAQSNYVTAQNRRDEVSAVSLDEEFAGLIKFQKAYQASAKMIRVAEELLDQLTQLL